MTDRERVLAWTVGPIVAAVGSGFLLYWCLVKPLVEGALRVAVARNEVEEAQTKLQDEGRVEKRIVDLDPRLRHWQRTSVPESPDRAPTAVTAHNTRMQDEYQRLISKLFRDNGLNMTVLPKLGDPDSKNAPALSNKTPLYTRFVFNFEAEGSYDAFIKMMEQFERIPLLHKVSKLEMTRPTAAAAPVPVRGAVPARPGGGRGNTTLKYSLTLELLQVNGAEKRYTLLPYSLGAGLALGAAQAVLFTQPGTARPSRVLAYPDRVYSDMLAKNIFFGQSSQSDLTSDHFEPLRFHKLVCIIRTGYSRPEGMVYDQRKPVPNEAQRVNKLPDRTDNRYMFMHESKIVDYVILDDYGNEIIAMRVVDVTPDDVFFKVLRSSAAAKRITEKRAFPQDRSVTTDRPLIGEDPEQIYRMHVGDFLTQALASRFLPPKSTADKQDKTEKVDKTEKIDKKEEVVGLWARVRDAASRVK